ncbi:Alpha-L-rhamnosidase rgxB [Pseudocercospora fuligena]|uniref:Alpha-L-rhamnosidase rgxB n=1 Tax=Pseudocercospora fuligena TaxID=685502 RepID=A0A8H6RWQ0_9PEZI|nr:Alpha-L-rhamnosidase rgxB [Pseudocercospora fuligena]
MQSPSNLKVFSTYFLALLPLTFAATCTIPSHNNALYDDTPAILSAFSKCGNNGHIIFSPNTTYHINTVMNTTSLSDVQIDIHGYLLWSTNITHWLETSMPVGYQNQSTVWFLGGKNITVNGHGTGTFDGNGQVWYDFVQGESNYPRRPMGLTIWKAHSKSTTGQHESPARNTDGADVLYSNNVTMRRWEVDNGDDAIALKGNSTNILIEDCVFRTGQGFALGSIGQYADRFEVIEDVVVRNIRCIGTKYAAYVKTWTGEQSGYPPNGGGGGKGYIRNITMTNFTMDRGRTYPFSITQCTAFGGTTPGDCDSSEFKVEDITLSNVHGSVNSSTVAVMQCSEAAGGCDGIKIEDVVVENLSSSANATMPNAYKYLCSNVESPASFECTGNVTSNPGGS